MKLHFYDLDASKSFTAQFTAHGFSSKYAMKHEKIWTH